MRKKKIKIKNWKHLSHSRAKKPIKLTSTAYRFASVFHKNLTHEDKRHSNFLRYCLRQAYLTVYLANTSLQNNILSVKRPLGHRFWRLGSTCMPRLHPWDSNSHTNWFGKRCIWPCRKASGILAAVGVTCQRGSVGKPLRRKCWLPAVGCWERRERDALLLISVLEFHAEKVIVQKGNIFKCPFKMANWQYLYKDLKVNALMVSIRLLFYRNIELFHTATLLFAGIHYALSQSWKYISLKCVQRTHTLNIIFSQPFKFCIWVPHNSLLPKGNSF